jgi:hypothetical protein
MKELSLHAIRTTTEIIQTRCDIERNPKIYLSSTFGDMQASASQPPDPH